MRFVANIQMLLDISLCHAQWICHFQFQISDYLLQAADVINVTNKNILVIGTQVPWVEAILLTKKPRKIVTLEYGQFIR